MCGNCNDPFHGLDDDLDDVFGGGPMSAEDIEAGKRLAAAEAARIHTERCPNCRGTGNWRPGYPCFKCKGSGKLTFKTDAATRAKAAGKRAEKADAKRIQLQADRKAWIEANADDFAWMNAKQESFDFARSMYDALMQYGSLTERQHATVTRLRLADAERAAARKAEAAAREANAPTVDVALIEKAFAAAQANGIKRPRMVLNGLKFSLAPPTGATPARCMSSARATTNTSARSWAVGSRASASARMSRKLRSSASPATPMPRPSPTGSAPATAASATASSRTTLRLMPALAPSAPRNTAGPKAPSRHPSSGRSRSRPGQGRGGSCTFP